MTFRCTFVAACGLALCAFVPRADATAASAIPIAGQRVINFDAGWRFFKGEAAGAEQPVFRRRPVDRTPLAA